MNTVTKALSTVVGIFALIIGLSFLLSLPVMLLWDAVVPQIFNLPEITWLQAWGLSLLCNLLFKSHTSVSNS